MGVVAQWLREDNSATLRKTSRSDLERVRRPKAYLPVHSDFEKSSGLRDSDYCFHSGWWRRCQQDARVDEASERVQKAENETYRTATLLSCGLFRKTARLGVCGAPLARIFFLVW